MKKLYTIFLASLTAFVVAAQAQQSTPLRLVQTIPLPGVEGRIDHFAVDANGQRLFVSALGNNTLEVLDLRAGKRIHSIRGLEEPQGVLYVQEFNKIFVADGGDGKCRIFDGNSYQLVGAVDFPSDADNLRYDSATKRVFVGYGEGALGIIDAASLKRLGDILLEAHPESFQLEKSGPRIFVNVPKAGHIAVIDRERRAVVSTWLVKEARANFPMTLDEAHHRLFVICRRPAQMLVFDTNSGREVAWLPVVGDADDMFYDASHRRLYVTGGEGFISVVEQRDADHYQVIAKIPTASGARTSFFVPELKRLYVAVPRRANQSPEIRVFEIPP